MSMTFAYKQKQEEENEDQTMGWVKWVNNLHWLRVTWGQVDPQRVQVQLG